MMRFVKKGFGSWFGFKPEFLFSAVCQFLGGTFLYTTPCPGAKKDGQGTWLIDRGFPGHYIDLRKKTSIR
jgi:hypothetical protein